MRPVNLTILIAIGALSPWLTHACQAQIGTPFDTVAPTATDILAVQVESLALEADPAWPEGFGYTVRGKIRILKRYRGSGLFTDIKYHNSHCAALRIDVGGIYLIATSSQISVIELNSYPAPILHLSSAPFDPELILRSSPVIERLETALRGDGNFAIATPLSLEGLSTLRPPPPVPPPEAVDP